MSTTQIALVQLDNYGPWTVTPEPRRETDLQSLQARIYADLCQQVGDHDGYAFYTRFDNMIAVTNGLDRADHARIQETLNNRYPVTASVGVGVGETPAAALTGATDQLQDAGSAQDSGRRAFLGGDFLADHERTPRDVGIAHFDVVDATGTYTDRLDAFDTYREIQRATLALSDYMRETNDSLSFFVGGDNVIAVCPELREGAFQAAIDNVRESAGVELQVGVGRAAAPHDAGMAAKHALEECRYNGTRIEGVRAPACGD